jgi:2-keto-4-pentenoate hydratase/2-oxohepta-3-ene-1,7-dioic acid hydratase in catechol pathway
MKLCTFDAGAGPRLGVVATDGKILDVQQHSGGALPAEMLAFLRAGETAGRALGEALTRPPAGAQAYETDAVRLLAPLSRPNSMRDCLAFEQHLKNSMPGREIPQAWYEIPCYYKGNPDTVQGTGADVEWPSYTNMLDYELEFAAIIGREGRDISKDEAWSYIAGYTVFNDVSARDIQMKEMALQLGPAKGKDMEGGNILGPYLVTADEWDPRDGHTMLARVNGEEWSRGTTDTMYHDFGAIVSYISMGETIHVGDVIGSGTVGTGCGLELRRFPKPGDVIELEIEGIGVLRNRFVKK